MCYTQRKKIEGGVGALRESDDSNFLKPNGRSRNLHIYAIDAGMKDLMIGMLKSYSACS